MIRMKLKRVYMLAAVLGVAAFLGNFYLAFAGIVQWSREQPAEVSTIAAEVLPPESMTVFQDAALTDELLADEVLEFPSLVTFQPPLNNAISGGQSEVRLWLRNDSETPLAILDICCPGIFHSITQEIQANYFFGPIQCCSQLIQPGEAQEVRVGVFSPRIDFGTLQFFVILGSTGEVTDEGAAVTSISPLLQSVLDASSKQQSER